MTKEVEVEDWEWSHEIKVMSRLGQWDFRGNSEEVGYKKENIEN